MFPGGKNMDKKILTIIALLILLIIGLSGCNEKQEVIKEQEKDLSELTPTNLVIKNITYSPKFPVEKDEIIFTIEVENIGDNTSDYYNFELGFKDRDGFTLNPVSNSFNLEGHSKKNITITINKNLTDEYNQSFEIVMKDIYGNEIADTFHNIEILILPLPPEIYYFTPASYLISFRNFEVCGTFNVSDKVSIYYEYSDVIHDNQIQTYQTISVYHKESGVSYYNDFYNQTLKIDDSEIWYHWWSFYTRNWPKGEYRVDIGLRDENTSETALATTHFRII